MPTQTSNKLITGQSITTAFVADVGDKVVVQPDGTGVYVPGSGHYNTTVSSQPFSRLYLERQWSVTPGFNSKNRPVPLPQNGYSFLKITTTADGYVHIFNSPPVPGVTGKEDRTITFNNYSAGTSMLTYDYTSKLDTCNRAATQKLLENLKDMNFNLAQATAERKQTCDLVASTATKVAKALNKIKKGDVMGAGRALGVVPSKRSVSRARSGKSGADLASDAWLELQYGWKPLLQDVYGSVEALAKSQNNMLIGVAKGHKTIEEAPSDQVNHLGSAKGYDRTTRELQAKVSAKVGIVYVKSSPAVAQVASLGITNPALLAWELLPYSFVVDWFLPIGNYLNSLDATLGLTFKSGYRTTFVRVAAQSTRSTSALSGNTFTDRSMRETTERIMITRTALSSFPSAPAPRFKNPLSTSHVASAMALLHQISKR
jgi:hypothetical protein